MTTFSAPTISPAYLGVGYIIGPELAALNFSGGVLAWGLLVPLLIFFLGPQLQTFLPAGAATQAGWALANAVWRYIVRPDRRGRHDGGRVLHAVPHAQEPGVRACSARSPTCRSRRAGHETAAAPSAT